MNSSPKSNSGDKQRISDFSYPKDGELYFDKNEEIYSNSLNNEIFHMSSKINNSNFLQEINNHKNEDNDLYHYLNNSEQTISEETSKKIRPKSKNILDKIFE
jgi:hypothetical protein